MAKRKKVTDDTEILSDTIIKGLQEKKAKDIVVLDMRALPNTVCEKFIICTGDSNTHVDALSGSAEEMVRKELAEKPWHVEGVSNSEWILMDYVNIVVHIFQPEARTFYNLENLWADAEITRIQDL
ncbi:MAG: ribosome silencing factor [Bacteroidota bacterium]